MAYSQTVQNLAVEYINKVTSSLAKWKTPEYLLLVEETQFLPPTATTRQRMWHVLNNSTIIPKCAACDNPTKWYAASKPAKYSTFCCSKCNSSSVSTKSKKATTNIERYGVDSFSKTDTFKQKISGIAASTWVEAVGKRKATNLERYGVEQGAATPQAIEQRRATNVERYGHQNVLASQHVKDIKTERYGTDAATLFPGFEEKRLASMVEKYGVQYSGQNVQLLDAMQTTMEQRYGNRHYKRSLISPASLERLDDRQWLIDQHHTNKIPLSQISSMLDVDLATVRSRLKLYNIDTIRHCDSYPEQQIAEFLSLHNIQYIRGDRKILRGRELDFVIESHNLAIEYCGLYWHSTAHQRNTPSYHAAKLKQCNDAGYRLITIFEDEWVDNQQLVLNKIANILKIDNRQVVYGRKTTVVNVNQVAKKAFFDAYHIQGDGPGSITLALSHAGQIVAMITFIKQKNDCFILNRYATACSVPGGFSKLMSAFENQYNWKQIVSFADLRWSEGGLYQQMGFELDKKLSPDYYYVDTTNIKRIHKFNFRHSNLPNILGDRYNSSLSETENTRRNNWFKIYNCGLLRYVKYNK